MISSWWSYPRDRYSPGDLAAAGKRARFFKDQDRSPEAGVGQDSDETPIL